MTGTSKVAVITRTKDRPTFLRRALLSVGSQTERNYTHLIYNDGGDSELVERVIKEVAPQHSIKVVHGKGSNGKEDTIFNAAIAETNSEYIALHDDDDTWHPKFLELALQRLREASAEGVVVRTDRIDEEILSDGTFHELVVSRWMPDLKYVNLYRQCIDNQMTAITFLYSRKAYNEVGGYDDNLAVCGDWDFGIRFLLKYDVEFLDPGYALAFYHHRKYKRGSEGNTSGSDARSERFHYYTNYMLNKYLREELAEGKMGVGYIMSKLRYEQSYMSRMAHKMLPKWAAQKLKRKAQS